MSDRTKEVLKAIRCCRDDFCTQCPLQKEICDELCVGMEKLPSDLVDMIEEELEEMLKHNTVGHALDVLRGNGWKEVK